MMLWILGYFIVGFGISVALTIVDILDDKFKDTDDGLESRVMCVVAWPFLLLFFAIIGLDRWIRNVAKKIHAIFWMDKEDK